MPGTPHPLRWLITDYFSDATGILNGKVNQYDNHGHNENTYQASQSKSNQNYGPVICHRIYYFLWANAHAKSSSILI